MNWEHITQVPPVVRQDIDVLIQRIQEEDRAIFVAICEMRIKARLPEICSALKQAHSKLSQRQVFRAVALST